VSTHLYRIFPKLGITTREALRDALETTARSVPSPLNVSSPEVGHGGEHVIAGCTGMSRQLRLCGA
jgi:hypothetical protein